MADEANDLDPKTQTHSSGFSYDDMDHPYPSLSFDDQSMSTPRSASLGDRTNETASTTSASSDQDGQDIPSKRSRRRGKRGRNRGARQDQVAQNAQTGGAYSGGDARTMKDETGNYDFLWEPNNTRKTAKGDAGTTTVVESDTDYLLLPHPDVFNAYPPEVQRKIMEWADRDVRARRDDESLRQDALIRAQAARERTLMAVPVAIILLCIVCAAVTGLYTKSAVFAVAFLIVALAVILAIYFTRKNDLYVQSEPTDEEGNE